nr:epidermal growth factor receptor isoform X1 [Crassostrea gigas]
MYSIRRELAESINRHQRENPRQSEWADGRRKPLGNQSYPHRILSVALRTKAQGLFTQARMKSDLLLFLGYLCCVSHAGRRRKVCPGLKDPDYVNYSNIQRFKGCTKITGNIIISDATFNGDPYLNLMGLHPHALKVFENVQDITGCLVVQGYHPDFTSLSYFKNLSRIRGKRTLLDNSLTIAFTSLKYLGMTSLKSIQRGNVMIASNKDLCYVDSIEFQQFFRRSRNKRQRAVVQRNKPLLNCVSENAVCSLRCSSKGCWGPGYKNCVEKDTHFSNLIDNMLWTQSLNW